MRISDWSSDVCSSDLAEASVVDQHIETPEAFFGSADHVLDVDADRDVDMHRDRRCADRRRGLCFRTAAVGTDDLGTFAREQQRPLLAHAGTGAGDDRDLVFQACHLLFLFFRLLAATVLRPWVRWSGGSCPPALSWCPAARR